MGLDKRVKADWVAALRSGKYEQSRYRLKDDRGYCCLGVLCEINGALNKQGEVVFFGNNTYHEMGLPVELLDCIGLSTGSMDYLTVLNDHRGATFKQIANHIEANL